MAGFFIEPGDAYAPSDGFVSHESYEGRQAEFARRAEFHNTGAAAFAALADKLNPPPVPEPRTAREAHTHAAKMLFDVHAIASDCDAKAEGLAAGFMARKTTAGRRGAVARNMSALIAEMETAETVASEAKGCLARWAERPGLPAPLVDLAPHVFASVADTLSLARARIKVACDMRAGDAPDMDIMGCMGAASDPDAQPGAQPETQAERQTREDAVMMAEMGLS